MSKIAVFLSALFVVFSASAQESDFIENKSPTLFEEKQEEFLKVHQAYQVAPTVSNDNLSFLWSIHPGYYLYQHQFKVEARNADTSEKIDLTFEKGKLKFDEIFQKELEVYYGSTTVSGPPATLTPPYELKVSSQGCADAGLCYPPRNQYFSVAADGSISETETAVFQSAGGAASGGSGAGFANAESPSAGFMALMLLFALVGGLILNLLPCVFPVLSLKALSFSSSHLDSHKQHLHGWSYTVGVIVSFAVAGAVIVAARGAGDTLNWGFQLQVPAFVAFMAYLFFAMGLSLSGLFHIGTSWMGVGHSLTTGNDYKSSFFTGVLAALVASPCTGPLMAPALGFAITQPAYIAMLFFVVLGFGMALPFLLLSYSPKLAEKLPAPGAWMETLKQALAFPLYLTAVWLLWVLGNQTSSTGAAVVVMGGVLIAFGVWLLQQKPSSFFGKTLVKGSALASLLVAGTVGLNAGDYRVKDSGMWEAYSPQKLEDLRSEGLPIFVDLTADWCITCKFNERVALNTTEVAKFASLNDIIMLQGDFTNPDPDISALLEEFGRSGVPLYLMYPADPSKPPEVLPQILTEELVLQSMERALL